MTDKFDCIEFQDREAERIYRETDGMTREQEMAYWASKTSKRKVHSVTGCDKKTASSETPRSSRNG